MSISYMDRSRSFSPKASPEFDSLVVETLSVRAQNTLQLLDVNDEKSLMRLEAEDLMAAQHCGLKTSTEILKFKKIIEKNQSDSPSRALDVLHDRSLMNAEDRHLAFDAIAGGMSSRAKSVLRELGVKDLEDFALMPLANLPAQRGAGAVTAKEVRLIKTVFIEFLHESSTIKKEDRVDALCERLFHAMINPNSDWLLDKRTPYQSFRAWVVDTARGIEHIEQAFMMRSGLSGHKAMTLEKVGSILGLTRERVRQLNNEFAEMADWVVVQRRLTPIIESIVRKLKSSGGMIKKVELLEWLGEDQTAKDKLVNAQRFVDFIATFEPWRKRGLYHSAQEVFLKP